MKLCHGKYAPLRFGFCKKIIFVRLCDGNEMVSTKGTQKLSNEGERKFCQKESSTMKMEIYIKRKQQQSSLITCHKEEKKLAGSSTNIYSRVEHKINHVRQKNLLRVAINMQVAL